MCEFHVIKKATTEISENSVLLLHPVFLAVTFRDNRICVNFHTITKATAEISENTIELLFHPVFLTGKLTRQFPALQHSPTQCWMHHNISILALTNVVSVSLCMSTTAAREPDTSQQGFPERFPYKITQNTEQRGSNPLPLIVWSSLLWGTWSVDCVSVLLNLCTFLHQ